MEIQAVPLSPERHKSFYHREKKRAYMLFQTYGQWRVHVIEK